MRRSLRSRRRAPKRRSRRSAKYRGSGSLVPLSCPADGDCFFHALYRSAEANRVRLHPLLPGFPTSYVPSIRSHVLHAASSLPSNVLPREDWVSLNQRMRLRKEAGYEAWADVWDAKVMAVLLGVPVRVFTGEEEFIRFAPDGNHVATSADGGRHPLSSQPELLIRHSGCHFVPLQRT